MSETVIQVPAGLTTEGLLGRRYMARIIDSVIVLVIISALTVFAGYALARYQMGFASVSAVLVMILGLLITVVYYSILESSGRQASVGKRVMGLRVYNRDGGRMPLLQAAGRALLKDGPFFLCPLLPAGNLLSLGWLVVHLIVMHRSPVYQAIHDRVMGTWVAAPEEMTQLRIT